MKIHALPILYAKSSTGKIKQWAVCASHNPELEYGTVSTAYGYVDSKTQATEKRAYPKNVGKSNETTPFDQALSQAQSSWNSKVDKGYVTHVDLILDPRDVKNFLCMLAEKHIERFQDLVFPALLQPKLNGCRAIAKKRNGVVTMWSRTGKPWVHCHEIIAELTDLLEEGRSTDGELYVHGWTLQAINRAIKTRNDNTLLLEYHVYDFPNNETFEVREQRIPASTGRIHHVELQTIKSAEAVQEALQAFLDRGYEGMMIRNKLGLYKYGGYRSVDLQKCKLFHDAEFKVIGVKSATGKDRGTAVFKCITKEGKEFDVRPMGTRPERKEYFDNFEDKYNGEYLTVRYQELSEANIPTIVTGLCFRLAEDLPEQQ
jgi:DNA ligase-1